MIMVTRNALYVFILAGLYISLYGCATPRAVVDKSAEGKITWPGPPETPRITFLWSLSVVSSTGRVGGGNFFDILMGEYEGDPLDPRTSATLLRPYSLYVDGNDSLYIADTGALRITIINMKDLGVRHIIKAGARELQSPVGVVADRDGRVYVTDSLLGTVYIMDKDGKLLKEFQGEFLRPTCLAIDQERNIIYVADTLAHKIYVHGFDGRRISEIGRYGSGDGEFNFPTHVWVHGNGDLYVTDAMNFRIQILTPDGTVKGVFGRLGDALGHMEKPKGVATDSRGNVYVVDSINDMVKIYNTKGQLLLTFGKEGRRPGEFWLPSGIYIDEDDVIYVADTYNRRVQVFKYLRDE